MLQLIKTIAFFAITASADHGEDEMRVIIGIDWENWAGPICAIALGLVLIVICLWCTNCCK